MSRSIAVTGAAAVALAASLLATPAYAQAGEFPITVTPDEAHPGETVTVTGDATDPTCSEDGVAVQLNYTKPDGTLGTVSVNTTTDVAGHFSAEIDVPDAAVAGEDASVNAVIADCVPPAEESQGTRSSESEPFDVLAYTGDLTLSETSGEPGDVVSFAGTNCWGGETVFYFGPDAYEGEPDPDKTFEGEFEVPDYPDGTYEVTAECPGTDYRVLSFRLRNPRPAPAPPARPVPRRPTFTG